MEMPRSGVGRYLLALLAAAAALAASDLLQPFLGTATWSAPLWAAIVFSAWCCGLAPSILTALSGAAGVWYLFLTPHRFLATPGPAGLFRFAEFLLVAGFIAALGETNRRAQFALVHRAHVLDAANDAIIELNPADDTIRYWNRGAENLYGWTRSEAMGRNIDTLLKTRSPQPLGESKAELMQHGNWEGEVIHLRRNGTEVYVASRSTLQHETEGQPAIWLEINRDITERRKAEQELQKAEEARRVAQDLALKELEKQVRERTAELEQSNQQLRQLSASLLRTQDDERRRIARELHDSAGQYLGGVSIALEVAQREQQAANLKLDEAAQLAKGCAQEIRTISHLLHPPLIEDLGLASAAQWYVEGFAARSGIRVELEIPGQLDRLGDHVELVLFRILQESLTNIHRHSGSKTAAVRIGADSRQAWLEVQDYGKGAAADGPLRPGMGITGMRERVKDLAGILEIDSGEKGTRVRAVLPLSGRSGSQGDFQASSAG